MSVVIDGKELGEFLDFGDSWLKGREYRGKGIEEEGKKIESWLKDYSKGMNVRVKDNKFPEMIRSMILCIEEISSEWRENVFHFRFTLKNV